MIDGFFTQLASIVIEGVCFKVGLFVLNKIFKKNIDPNNIHPSKKNKIGLFGFVIVIILPIIILVTIL